MSIFKSLLNSTARIETVDQKGQLSTGTSFFFAIQLDQEKFGLLLITNRHVLHEKQLARVAVSTARDGVRSIQQIVIPDVQSRALYHPQPQVDLAALPFGGGYDQIAQTGEKPAWNNVTQDLIIGDHEADLLSPYENLVMVGYPNGIWDPKHNLPILRSGNTATPLYVDHNGKPIFLINAACFPGSSGSPIFLANEGAYSTPEGITMGTRVRLVGVLSATYTQQLTGEIVETNIPTNSRVISVANLPIHIGICIKAREINSIIELARSGAVQAA